MSVVVQRSSLTDADKAFIRETLSVTTNSDPPVTVKPFKVDGEDVRLPFAFYSELREFGKHSDWPVFPNDALHPARFSPEWSFTATLRDYQKEVWTETLPILQARHTILLQLYCGWGKTLFTAYIASKVQLVTLILYHISPLGRSWPSTFSSFTNAVVCHLGHDKFNPNAHIYICTVGMALSDNFPLNPKMIGVLAIDEAHAFCSPQRIFSLLRFQPKYLIQLTATPDKSNGLGKLINTFGGTLKEGEVPTCIIRISSKPFTVYKCQTAFKPRVKSTDRGLDWQEVKNSLLPNADPAKSPPLSFAITKLICDWATENPHKKILIPCIQISQVKAIAEELRKRGDSVSTLYGKDDSYDECRILVAIGVKVQVGFDDRMSCRNFGGRTLDMVILAWSYKDKGVIEQTVGRMRGENGVVIDIVHNFSSFTKHFKNREEWYLSRKGVVKIAPIPVKVD